MMMPECRRGYAMNGSEFHSGETRRQMPLEPDSDRALPHAALKIAG